MTFKEKLALDKERGESARRLEEARSVALTAIGSMESDANIFSIYADADWMTRLDPEPSSGPRMIATITSAHLTKLAAELRERLEKGAEENKCSIPN